MSLHSVPLSTRPETIALRFALQSAHARCPQKPRTFHQAAQKGRVQEEIHVGTSRPESMVSLDRPQG